MWPCTGSLKTFNRKENNQFSKSEEMNVEKVPFTCLVFMSNGFCDPDPNLNLFFLIKDVLIKNVYQKSTEFISHTSSRNSE